MYRSIKEFKKGYHTGTNFAERWVGHVACIQEKRNHSKFSRENLKERNHMEDLDVDVKIQLKWILKE